MQIEHFHNIAQTETNEKLPPEARTYNAVKLTSGFLNSFGLMQRTKNGWQVFKVFISASRDFLNCEPRVGERLRVSGP